MLVFSIAYAWFCFSHSISIAACCQNVHFVLLLLPCMICVHFTLENACVAAASAVRPDTAHINIAWQGIGMDSLVCSTVLLLLPTYHTIQMTHLPHVWNFIHDDSM